MTREGLQRRSCVPCCPCRPAAQPCCGIYFRLPGRLPSLSTRYYILYMSHFHCHSFLHCYTFKYTVFIHIIVLEFFRILYPAGLRHPRKFSGPVLGTAKFVQISFINKYTIYPSFFPHFCKGKIHAVPRVSFHLICTVAKHPDIEVAGYSARLSGRMN